ncbi:acyl-CoA carboxylase subunit beta [Pseudonocardia nematodicida]|uniref:acyl-CoA carboxylase subunit beta n=1 Tax=Pseudonocardia nematodicida TaxID=1206997 RepID=UPI003A97FF28
MEAPASPEATASPDATASREATGVAPTDAVHRLELFFDPGSCELLTPDDGVGARAARGLVAGTPAYAFGTEPARRGGAVGSAECAVIAGAIDDACDAGAPVIGLWHSGGARLDEGVRSLEGVGSIFSAMVRASGRVPQISVILGPAAGGAAYGAALTDVVIQADAGRMFVTGPDVIRQVTGEVVGMRDLGGPEVHDERSGVAHVTTGSSLEALSVARELTTLLAGTPGRTAEPGPRPALRTALPERAVRAYDVGPLLDGLLDDPGVELQPGRAPNLVTRLGRLGGRPVGVVANNPIRLGGCLNAAASEKGARFVRMCDALGIPLVVVVDVPGYLPGVAEEHTGVLRHGAKLLHAFAGARVPRVTLVTRKAFGGAYLAMNARSMGATAVYAWPTAEVAVMGAEAAVDILHRRKLAAATDEDRPGLRAGLVAEQRDTGTLERLAAHGVLDGVIEPEETPAVLFRALEQAGGGRSDQRNIPL